jgi:hypothetical protein
VVAGALVRGCSLLAGVTTVGTSMKSRSSLDGGSAANARTGGTSNEESRGKPIRSFLDR